MNSINSMNECVLVACSKLIEHFHTSKRLFPSSQDLDVSLSPSGTIIKNIGESLEVVMQKNASDEIVVSWTKVGIAVSLEGIN